MNMWTVYILRCADNSLYTGITIDIERRLVEHNTDNKRAASYTRSRRPVELVYSEPHPDRAAASRREAEIKQLDKTAKEQLIARCSTPGELD